MTHKAVSCITASVAPFSILFKTDHISPHANATVN